MDAHELHQKLQRAGNKPVHFPIQVTRRVHALLGDEQPDFVDVGLTINNSTCSGEALVVTPTRIVYAVFKDTPRDVQAKDDLTFTVETSTWARSSLIAMSLHADEDNGLRRNPDHEWAQEYEDWWPQDCYVTLSFEHGQSIEMPLSDQPHNDVAKSLRGLVTSLAEDLS